MWSDLCSRHLYCYDMLTIFVLASAIFVQSSTVLSVGPLFEISFLLTNIPKTSFTRTMSLG